MCGFIAGKNNISYDKNVIEKALSMIKHRGPDDEDIVFLDNNKIFFGHRRLSIVGIDNGRQPLTDSTGNIIAVVNGEFYDYKDIKKTCIKEGYQFKTQSDSEMLIALYKKYGVKCLEFLHGEFAFVLYDNEKKIWFSARDRMGIRPLNYNINNNNILFGSEAKAILPLMNNKSLDKESFWFSQHMQYLPQNKTLFEGVNMLPPATYMIFADGKCHIHSYWSSPTKITTDSFDESSIKIDQLLKEAVQKRIPEEVKWCTHLSGGIDSGIVSYLSSQMNTQKKIDCFTVSFTDDGFYDELPLATEMAKSIHANLHIVPVSFKESLEAMPLAIYHAEGLSINGHIGAKYLLNKSIHDNQFKVALTGEGSDEIFMGYSHLKQDFLSEENLNKMEKTYLGGVQLPDGKTLDLSMLESISNGFVPTWIKAKSSMAYKLSQLWHEDFRGEDVLPQFIKESHYKDIYNQYGKNKMSSILWSKYCLTGYILKVLDDAQSMAFSIEGRLPFLDTKLMEYVATLPNEYYFKGNIEKYLLRDLYKDKLPASIVNKTKQSFMSPPIQRALKDKVLYNFICGYLLDNVHFEKQHLFSREKLINILEVWKNENSPTVEPILMTILSIAMFCDEFKL